VRIHEGLSCAFTRDFHCRAHLQGMHPCSLSCIHEGLSCAITRDCHCRAHLQGMHPCSLSCAFTRGCRAHSQGIVIAVRIYKGCIPANCRARSRGIVVRIHKGLSLPCAFTRNASLIIVVRIHRQAGCKTLVAWQAQVPCCSANAWCAAVQMHGLLQCKCMVFCSANA